MGYYTRYTLEAKRLDDEAELIADFVSGCEEASFALTPEGASSDSQKWYDHEEHLKEFSARHPGYVFVLKGEGEEAGDIWAKYFVGGKVQVAKAELNVAEFDADRLV